MKVNQIKKILSKMFKFILSTNLFDKKVNVRLVGYGENKNFIEITPGYISIILSKITLTFKKVLNKQEKYWCSELNSIVYPYKILKLIYFYKFGVTFIKPKEYKPINYPVIYTLSEIKTKYPNRWMIPTSPDILVKHNDAIFKFSELKPFYE